MKTSLLRSSVVAAVVALGAFAWAGPAFAAESPEAAIQSAIDAVAAHNQKEALSLITSASQAISAKNPHSPALVSLQYAEQNVKAGRADRALQDLYTAEPLVNAE